MKKPEDSLMVFFHNILEKEIEKKIFDLLRIGKSNDEIINYLLEEKSKQNKEK